MAGLEAARLMVRVGGDASGALRAMDQADDRLSSLANTAAVMGAKLTGALTLPLAGAGAAALKGAAEYETGLNIMQAVSGATAEQMLAVADLAKTLGADLTLPATSAADAANAMVELAKAGLSVDDVMGAAKGTLQLAAAGALDEAEAARIAAGALNAFGLQGERMSFITDMFAAAANASAVEVVDLGKSFQMAASVFSAFQAPVVGAEQSVADLTTAIAVLGNAGIRGSDAGTSLKQMILQLTAPSKQAKGLMGELAQSIGLSGDIAFDAQGKMRAMPEIVKIMAQATADMTDEARAFAVTTIFGADASRAIIALMAAQSDEAKALGRDWDSIAGKVTTAGAANELASARMKGLGGSMQGLQSQLETFALTVVEPFLGPLAQGVQAVSAFVGSLGEMPRPLIDAGVAVGVVLASVGPLTLAFAGLTAALGFLLSPVGLVTVGVAALAAAFASDFMGIRTAVVPVLTELGALFSTFAEKGRQLEGLAAVIGSVFGGEVMRIFEGFTTIIANGANRLDIAAKMIAIAFQKLGSGDIQAALDIVGRAVNFFLGGLLADIQKTDIANALREMITAGIDALLGSEAAAKFEGFSAMVGEAFAGIQAKVEEALGVVVPFVVEQFGFIIEWVQANLPLMAATVEKVLTTIHDIWVQVWPLLEAVVRPVWETISGVIENAIHIILGVITLGMQLITGDWEGAWETFKGILSHAWDAVTTILNGAVDIISAVLGGIFSVIGDIAHQIGDKALEIGANIIAGIVAGITAGAGAIRDAAGLVATGAIDAAKAALGISSPSEVAATEIGLPFGQGIALGIGGSLSGIEAAATGLAEGMAEGMVESIGKASARTRTAVDSFALGISEGLRDSGLVEQFGTIGAQAISNLAAFMEKPDVSIGAKVANTIQRLATDAAKAGATGLQATFAELENVSRQILAGDTSTDLLAQAEQLTADIFNATGSAKVTQAAQKATQANSNAIFDMTKSMKDTLRLQLSPEQGGGLVNLFLESLQGAAFGGAENVTGFQKYSEQVLKAITAGMDPLKAISVADQFQAAIQDAMASGDMSGLQEWLKQFNGVLASGMQQAKQTANFGISQVLSGYNDYLKSIQFANGRVNVTQGTWAGQSWATATIGQRPPAQVGPFGQVMAGGAPIGMPVQNSGVTIQNNFAGAVVVGNDGVAQLTREQEAMVARQTQTMALTSGHAE